jgi:hypothetical protein
MIIVPRLNDTLPIMASAPQWTGAAHEFRSAQGTAIASNVVPGQQPSVLRCSLKGREVTLRQRRAISSFGSELENGRPGGSAISGRDGSLRSGTQNYNGLGSEFR